MKKISIHYIDDDEEDLEFFKAAAHKVPSVLNVHTYMRNNEFLNAIENVDVAKTIVFLDINMPGKSGIDILKILRSNDKLKSLSVIMYSTSKDQKVIDISKEFGADYYAVKPASYLSIEELIKHVLTIDWSISVKPDQNFLLTPTS